MEKLTNRPWLVMVMILLLGTSLSALPTRTHAAPLAQDDPVAQCAEGVQLFVDGQYAEALPLLEAGFAGREEAAFANPDHLGMCAMALGKLRDNNNDWTGALEAYAVAVEVLNSTGDEELAGLTLYNMGVIYDRQGRFENALNVYGQALTIHRKLNDRVREGNVLSNIGVVYAHQGHFSEALEAYRQALDIAREIGDPLGEGGSLNNIAEVYISMGRYTEALEICQQALVIARELGYGAGEQVVLHNLGAIYEGQGRYNQAVSTYRQALAIARELGDRVGERESLNGMGIVIAHQGHYAEALDTYRQALDIARKVGDRAGEGVTLSNIGEVYTMQGRYADALEVLQQSLIIARAIDNRPSEGITLNNIGVVYHDQGRYVEALNAYHEALAIYQDLGDQAGEGITLNNIGGLHYTQERYTEALQTYQEALAIHRAVGNRRIEGLTVSNIGDLYTAQGDYADALGAFQQALAIHREVGDRASEGMTLHSIGVAYAEQGHYIDALDMLRQALAITREVGNRRGEGITLLNSGFVYERLDEPDRALGCYEQAMEALESMRAVAGSEQSRASFIAQHVGVYDLATRLLHEQGQQERAFFTSERGRARAFLDSLATGYVELSDQMATELLIREQDTYAACQDAQDALTRARARNPRDAALVTDLEAQLATVEKEHTAALSAIDARHDQLAALVPSRDVALELPEVQALLDNQTTLVSFYAMGDKGTIAFVITHDSLITVDLPDATPDNLRTTLRGLNDWPSLEDPVPQPLQDLYTWLLAPLADHLRTPLVGIIPYQLLHHVPFAALSDGETYFGQQHTLFTLPSASALPFIQKNAEQAAVDGQELAVVVGNPTTGDYDPVASLATERDSLGNLPFAEEEAKVVAALYGTEPIIGQDATESIVRAQSPQADILHLAAHGKFNPVAPLSSLIALAPDDEYDGWLTVGEVYGLDLNQTDLVVLSACETQLGDLSAGDELVGLTRAFFFAGTPTVVASLWSVDDAATQKLMVAFYKHWQSGMSKAEALQAAQAEVRENHPSPFFWAAFVLSGDPGAVTRAIPSPTESPVSMADTQPPETEGKGSGGMCGTVGLVVPLLLLGVCASLRRWRFR